MALKLTSEDDQTLVARFRKTGDLQVLTALYQPYTALVYGVCLKYLRDKEESRDAVMQIFEKLITLLPAHEVHNFKSWLHSVTRNYCLMELRSRKGKNFSEIDAGFMESVPGEHPSEESEIEENLSKLEKCLATLNPEQYQCVKAFYLEKLSYREVETATGFTALQVKSFIQNGKRNLKMCMERE